MNRLVLTIATGKRKFAEMAMGLGRSLSLIGDTTPRAVITDRTDYDWKRYFDLVLPPEDPPEMIFFTKLTGLARTEFNQILFVDGDTLAFQKLDPIFTACEGKRFAVQGHWVKEGDWYGRIKDHCQRHGVQALPRFNGGMIYYERHPETEAFIAQLRADAPKVAEMGIGRDDPLYPDEPLIAIRMAQSGFGTLLPEEVNFTNSAVGLVGKLRMNVLTGECSYVCRRHAVRHVEPILFHASRYSSFFIYWRQLDRLKWLERYEDRHPYGYIPPIQKLRRSVERRWLKHIARKFD